ncbi:tigger transposable element-derived protein 1 [Trichonephila inaurata madagascariensis]|uniref:Tigger transposable element-derived protein 1 n=1 Tax=Trichonephila inaurata madagascariensis TaxID=2747483 RepID=A0A8X6IF86_9ARAC|nr:tigger transposable element-derived protein 1 [Trichonephila inaurata madagascariensis]
MPKRTFLFREEKRASGFKAAKDRLTLLLDLTTCIPVEVVFLPPNTTALIQPMDQGVISNFKAYYLRRTFKQMFEKTDGEEKQSIREFWKNYNVMNAVENINLSWNEITERSLKGVWKNIWPDLSKSEDIGHSVDMDEIVELEKQTGLDEVNVEDVEEIVQETAASLSNDELKELTEQEENKNIDRLFINSVEENLDIFCRAKSNGLQADRTPANRSGDLGYV